MVTPCFVNSYQFVPVCWNTTLSSDTDQVLSSVEEPCYPVGTVVPALSTGLAQRYPTHFANVNMLSAHTTLYYECEYKSSQLLEVDRPFLILYLTASFLLPVIVLYYCLCCSTLTSLPHFMLLMDIWIFSSLGVIMNKATMNIFILFFK